MSHLKYIISTILYGLVGILGLAATVYFIFDDFYFLSFLSIILSFVAFDNFFCSSRARGLGEKGSEGNYIVPQFVERLWIRHKEAFVFIVVSLVVIVSLIQLSTAKCNSETIYCFVPEGTEGALHLQYPFPVVPAYDVPLSCMQACGFRLFLAKTVFIIFVKVVLPLLIALVFGAIFSYLSRRK